MSFGFSFGLAGRACKAAGGAPDGAIVLDISPSAGNDRGGTSVVIEVDDSTGCTAATIGGTLITSFAVVDATHVSGITAAHVRGLSDVAVTRGGGPGSPLLNGFEYLDALSFDSTLSPDTMDPGSDIRSWHRADLGVTQALGSISAWADQSLSGDSNRNATQATPSSRPTLVSSDSNFNNRPVVSFDGVNDWMQTGVFSGGVYAQPTTWYFVVRFADTLGGPYVFDSADSGAVTRQAMLLNPGWDAFGGVELPDGSVSTSTTYVVCIVFNGASSAIYVNAYAAAAVSGNAGSLGLHSLTIGQRLSATGGYLSGRLPEIASYSGDHDEETRRRFMKNYLGDAYGAQVIDPPLLASANFDQVDVLGGGQAIVLSGTDLSGATKVTYGGTDVTPTSSTFTTVTFTAPAKAAGNHDVTVTTPGGTSNAITIETWAPTTDSAVSLLLEAPDYDGTTWTVRYSAVAGGNMARPGAAAPAPSATGGAPDFPGDGTKHGLRTDTSVWLDYVGAVANSARSGSVFSVFRSASTNGAVATDGTVYGNPQAFGNASQGTIGIAFGDRSGTQTVVAHSYGPSFGYRSNAVAASADALHSVVSRWDGNPAVNGTLDLSVDGAISGAYTAHAYGAIADAGSSYSSCVFDGHTDNYLGYPVYAGMEYSGGNVPATQTFNGLVKVIGVMNAKASDTFVTKFYKWSKQRHGVA